MATLPPTPPENPLHSDEKPPRRRPRAEDAPLLPATDAGPRPLSDRQKTRQAEGRAGAGGGGRVYAAPPVVPARSPYANDLPPAPAHILPTTSRNKTARPPRRNVTVIRDADTTRIRRVRGTETNGPRTNRRRTNYPRLLLGWVTAALCMEVIATAMWSPRLWVKSVRIDGNTTVPTARVLGRLHIGPRDNLVRLSTGKLRASVEAEPSVEWAEVRRTLSPLGVQVFVRERTPWASVQVNGNCYTIDRNLVPFRVRQTPESHLPRLVLSGAGSPPSKLNSMPVLGKPMTAPGLNDVSRCLAWSVSQTDFPLESVEIDPQGKLCLNKVGGLPVRLGSGVDLDKKLRTLATLLATRPELRESDGVEEINLFAFDAPAVFWRVASAAAPSNTLSVPSHVSPALPSGGEIVP